MTPTIASDLTRVWKQHAAHDKAAKPHAYYPTNLQQHDVPARILPL
jgi:hypothetical protein